MGARREADFVVTLSEYPFVVVVQKVPVCRLLRDLRFQTCVYVFGVALWEVKSPERKVCAELHLHSQ